MNTWLKVVNVYNATSTGGAKLSINGHSQSVWSISGAISGAPSTSRGDRNAVKRAGLEHLGDAKATAAGHCRTAQG